MDDDKRFEAALMAMGLHLAAEFKRVARGGTRGNDDLKSFAESSVACADALLYALRKDRP